MDEKTDMDQRHVVIRRHAIFKHQYERAVANAPEFHNMTTAAQWTLLRAQVVAESSDGRSALLEMLDSRESRRDEVLAKLEDGRQQDSRKHGRRA